MGAAGHAASGPEHLEIDGVRVLWLSVVDEAVPATAVGVFGVEECGALIVARVHRQSLRWMTGWTAGENG